jgi:FixJ family two-component response regulator
MARHGSTANIYIVDDDEAVRDSLRALFEAYGFEVRDFATSSAFLQVHDPAMRGCLLLDVNLPGLSGLGVLKLLAASGSDLQTIVMTGRADVRTKDDAIGTGAVGFVEKPFASGHLMTMVKGALHDQR